VFVDLTTRDGADRDPLAAVTEALVRLKKMEDILLVKYACDPTPLRDMFGRRGFASWAEERKAGEWFIYFYHPIPSAKLEAPLPVKNKVMAKAAGARA
jgi:hypothetical protein